jgi:hypothetical protein
VKQIIIMVAMVALGLAIFSLIAGSGEGSIFNTLQSVWEGEIILRTSTP